MNPKQPTNISRDWLADEFINWQIQNATLGKLGCLTDPFKIPHEQHWIMLSSVYKQNLQTPLVKIDIQGA